MDRDRLVNDIKQAEGFKDRPYKDTEGYWTGGYGHFLTPQDDGHWNAFLAVPTNRFDQSTVDNWLVSDLANAMNQGRTLMEWNSLDCDARQNAVIELVFNMGLETWRQFVQTRLAILHKEWQMAYNGLLDSKWAKEVQPHGFDQPGRATRIATYLLRGSFT